MVWRVPADLKQIHAQGRNFPWPRPQSCLNLNCNNWRVWGHGFVERYFEGFVQALPIKCYRCPECGCVITLRPESHFSRIRSSCQTIQTHLQFRISHGFWPSSSQPRSRLRHWLTNLRRQILSHLTHTWSQGLWAGYEELLLRGEIPVVRVG